MSKIKVAKDFYERERTAIAGRLVKVGWWTSHLQRIQNL